MIRAGIVVLIAIALPFLLGQFWAYQLGLYALYAVAAVGVGLCWGQAGFLPLGQALFFGLAAYLSGLAFIAFQDSPIVAVLALPLAALVAAEMTLSTPPITVAPDNKPKTLPRPPTMSTKNARST